jgi:hypothetical protein
MLRSSVPGEQFSFTRFVSQGGVISIMFSFAKSSVLSMSALFLGAAALCAQTPSYTFQVVAKTGNSIGGYTITNFSEPALLDDAGNVFFAASHSSGQGIFTPTQVLVKSGDTIGGIRLSSVSSPAVNSSGNLVFLGAYAGGSAIFTQNGALVKTGDTVGGQPIFNFYRGLSINANGAIAFQASTGTWYPVGTGVFMTAAGGNSQLLIGPGQTVAGKTLSAVGTPVINDQGAVGLRGEFANPNNANDTGAITIDTVNGTEPTLVAETGSVADGKTLTVFGFPAAVTQDGAVISRVNFDGGNGVFSLVPNGGGSRLLVQAGDPVSGYTLTQLGLVSVNHNGDLVFYSAFAGGSGIFTPNGLIAKTGDQVGLNTIQSILFNSAAYNANGTIAFTAMLDDGSKAVIVGQPANASEAESK